MRECLYGCVCMCVQLVTVLIILSAISWNCLNLYSDYVGADLVLVR
jgi:hypothetical protein